MIINLEIFKEYLFKDVWYIPIFRKPSHPGGKSINQHFLLPLLQPVPNLIREGWLQLNSRYIGTGRDTVGKDHMLWEFRIVRPPGQFVLPWVNGYSYPFIYFHGQECPVRAPLRVALSLLRSHKFTDSMRSEGVTSSDTLTTPHNNVPLSSRM